MEVALLVSPTVITVPLCLFASTAQEILSITEQIACVTMLQAIFFIVEPVFYVPFSYLIVIFLSLLPPSFAKNAKILSITLRLVLQHAIPAP